MSEHAFSDAERQAIYRVIQERRDMRHFRPDPVAPEVLQRLLAAAHAGPSVGLMQPWRFIRITDAALREALYQSCQRERTETAGALGDRREEFLRLKVEGIRECGELLVAVLADQRDAHVFGRRTLPHMDIASTACAIQNLWLAARAEGLGMGWVSIFDPAEVAMLLALPEGAEPLGILCLGHVETFYPAPMLELADWARRFPLQDVLMENGWHT